MMTWKVVCSVAAGVLGYLGLMALLLFGGVYLIGRFWMESEAREEA